MTDLSNSQETTVLNNIKTGGVYVSLHTADEGDEPVPAKGVGSTEVTAADYARQHLTEANCTVTTVDVGGSTLTNAVAISWGTTTSDWGTVTHAALWNTAVGGVGEKPYTSTVALGNAGAVPSGIEVRINAGELTFTVD